MRHPANLKHWAVLSFILATFAAILSVVLIIGLAAIVARIFFVVFAVLFLYFWVRHRQR